MLIYFNWSLGGPEAVDTTGQGALPPAMASLRPEGEKIHEGNASPQSHTFEGSRPSIMYFRETHSPLATCPVIYMPWLPSWDGEALRVGTTSHFCLPLFFFLLLHFLAIPHLDAPRSALVPLPQTGKSFAEQGQGPHPGIRAIGMGVLCPLWMSSCERPLFGWQTLALKEFQSQRAAFHRRRKFPAFQASKGRGPSPGQIFSLFQRPLQILRLTVNLRFIEETIPVLTLFY